MFSFAHIINPVTEDESKNLFSAQSLTFNSLIKAKEYVATPEKVSLYTVNRNDYNNFIPGAFMQLPALARDITSVLPGEKLRLPLLKDILTVLFENSDAEYLIYSNLDIVLMPYFYDAIQYYINKGHDAMIINRRRIDNRFLNEDDLNAMYAEVGKIHIGYDCFVFKRSLFTQFIMKDVCIGAACAGNDLFYNIFTFAQNPQLLIDKHLTFHVGLELHSNWSNKNINGHNYAQVNDIIKELLPSMDIAKFPWSDKSFLKRHWIWLMNPTLSYRVMLKLDAKRNFKKTINTEKDTYKPNRKNRYLESLIKTFYRD